ncbi:OmpA family protein [Cytophaga aurantiaca]|uniref:OmpA family protein n=1 Tax=Cytophaga aurantiaca TaxID=29530 RepID=UPI00036DB0FC|nr:OmpA family protein [Cytophaga aurantiaca]
MNSSKKLLAFIIILFYLCENTPVFAQQLTLFNIDTSRYPTVKADFFAIDQNESQVTTLTAADVFITENASAQEVVKVVNPTALKPKQISLVLTIDVSSSMEGAYIQLAKNAANAIVNKLPLDLSECAITSFDDISFVNTDFTRDKLRLQQSIQTLTPHGGTDYDKGFTKSNAGGLDILRNGLHEKVLIFLTDGYGNVNPPEIIQKAKAMGAKVYVITLGMNTPEELKRIVQATNGYYYENVISEQEINAAYLSILYRIQGLTPSTVEWVSTAACGYSKNVLFGDKRNAFKAAAMKYEAPLKHVVRLVLDVNNITFNATTSEIPVSIKAVNGNFSITSFNSSKPYFSIVTPSIPHTIKKDATDTFVIKYTGSSTEFISGRIELVSAGCQSTFIYYQYQPNSTKPAINLIAPDGKEAFYAGTDTLIRWNLQNTYAPVKISFSSNAGKDWKIVKDSCTVDHFNWRIPNKPGATNLIKVETIVTEQKATAESKIVYDRFAGIMNAYNLSPDGSRYISQTPTELLLMDTYTNTTIFKINNTIQNGYFIFSPDDKYIFIYDEGKPTKVYDAHTFQYIEEWGVFKKTLSSFIEPYINNDLTQYVALDADGTLGIFNFKTGAKVKSVAFVKGKEVTDFTRNYIVSLEESNHQVWVWDYKKGSKLLSISIPKERIVNAEFNKDETVLFVYTWGADGTKQDFTAYDLSGKELYRFQNSAKSFMSLDTYQNYAICSVDNYPALVDMNTGKVIHIYTLPGAVKFGWFVPFSNGTYILFTNAASKNVYMVTSGIENNKGGLLSDQSSSTFTIVSTKPEVKKINFPLVYVGSNKDSIVTAFMKNNVPIEIPVKSISIEGAGVASFKLLNPISSFTLNASSKQNLEIRFAPVKSGLQEAVLKVITAYDTVRVTISGTGIVKPYALKNTELNIGRIQVGKTIDTSFINVFTNTSKNTLYITGIELAGPDKTQFSLSSPSTYTLAAGASASIQIKFTATQRGRTSTSLVVHLKNTPDAVLIPVYAEGHLPRQYDVQFNFTDEVTKKPITATITCVDAQSNKSMLPVYINNGQGIQTELYADRMYIFSIQRKGYKTITDTINLLDINISSKIVQTYELIPDGTAEPVMQTLSGRVVNKTTQSPLEANILFFKTDSKVLIKKVTSAADGSYSIILPVALYSVQVEKDDYVNENTSVEVVEGNQKQTAYFQLIPIKVGETLQLPNVYFARGGVDLLESSNESLDQLYTLLLDNPTMRIELLGYTDNQGDPALNIQLSEKRVAAIKDYLVAKGISSARITGKGYGGAKPIASNATEETRQLNRRVEFKIVSK